MAATYSGLRLPPRPQQPPSQALLFPYNEIVQRILSTLSCLSPFGNLLPTSITFIRRRFHLMMLPLTLPSTLPSTLSSTLPSTLPTTFPSTLPSTFPSTLSSTLPSTLP